MFSYIDWHYFEVWPKVLLLWRNLTLFPFYYFSVLHHLRTLFAPYRRMKRIKKPGLFLDDILYVLFFNLSSRGIGFILRITTIWYGIFLCILLFPIGLILTLLWLLLPGITLPFYLTRRLPVEKDVMHLLNNSNRSVKRLLFLLLEHKAGIFVSNRLGISHQELAKQMMHVEENGNFNTVLSSLKKSTLSFAELFRILSSSFAPFNRYLKDKDITPEDVFHASEWFEVSCQKKGLPLLLDFEKIRNIPGIGMDWVYGYTPVFNTFSRDMTMNPSPFPFLVGRDQEIQTIEHILMKTEGNNVVIVGEPGVARHLLVETLAHRMKVGMSYPQLSNKRILCIDMHAVVSSRPSVLEVKGLAAELFEEAESAGNIVVFVDDIDKYLSSGEGRIDLTTVFENLAESSIGLIGITTPDLYNRFIESNPTFQKLFEVIMVTTPKLQTLMEELELSIVPVLERKYKITITYLAIQRAVENADKYISSTSFPGKAIELLDEVCLYKSSGKKGGFILAKDVDNFLEEKLHIPIGDFAAGEKERLLHLEETLHTRIINQEEAIRVVASSLRRARLSLSSSNRPIGSFLFLGPTGVGKTETAKAIADVYFGSKDHLLRFDMSQYQKEEGLERLIGSVKLNTPGELTSKLRERPFALLLLDEFEKGDKQLLNIFLTLTDEGYITDANGKRTDARNTIIIATSNAASEFIREEIMQGEKGLALQKKVIEYVQTEGIFSPEQLNRFDAVVVFTPLTEGQLKAVARLMLNDLNKRLSSKDISIAITDALVTRLASVGFDPTFGGRAMRRVISEKIEDQIATKLLKGEVKKGEKVEIEL